MKNGLFRAPIAIGAALVALAGSIPASAEVTADALLKVLVRKGVLTQLEADGVRAEAEREAVTIRVDGLAKAQADTAGQVAALKATVDKAARTQLSGYVQARAVIQDSGTPSNTMVVRRAYMSLKHTNGPGRLQFILDGGQNDITVKEASFLYNAIPARGNRGALTLQVGQYLRPFGFETERSSSVREFPEMPTAWGVLFPGIYDIGASATYLPDPDTALTLSLWNGSGAGSPTLPSRDTDGYKDVIARARHTVRDGGEPKMEVALSAYLGRQRTAGATPITGDRDRYGVAALGHDIAGGEVRAEYIHARDLTSNLAEGPSLVTAPAEAIYLLYTHPVSRSVTLGARYDTYDPDTRDDHRLGGDGEVKTLGFVAMRSIGENIRLTLAYESPRTTRYSVAQESATTETNNVLTLQGQYKF